MDEREKRRREIEAMTASLLVAPVVKHPSGAMEGLKSLNDEGERSENEESDEDEDDVIIEPPPASVQQPSSSSINSISQALSSSSSSSGSSAPTGGKNTSDFAFENKIPVSHEIDLVGHSKAVTCLSLEKAGNRLMTGSLDYHMKIFDFGGMDGRHKSFRSLEVDDNHPIISLAHSPSGDKVLVATGSAQPKIFDREGREEIKFVRGDMYIRDMAQTKGHTMEVSCVTWHPMDKNLVMTGGADGTIRIWNITGERAFGNLINKHVLKVNSKNGQQKIGVMSCCFTPDGKKMIAGAADGSIHIWNEKKVYSRPDVVIRPTCYVVNTKARGVQEIADSIKGYSVTSVVSSSDGKLLASKNEDGACRLWDLKRGQMSINEPVMEVTGLNNIYPTANVDFSPDNKWVVCTTSIDRSDKDQKSALHFFQLPTIPYTALGKPPPPVAEPKQRLVIGVTAQVIEGQKKDISAIFVKWQPHTNQIFCTTSGGTIKAFYDPRISQKGAMLTAGRPIPREPDPADQIVGEIYNPNALPMFRNTDGMFGPKRGRAYDKQLEKANSKVPDRPAGNGPGKMENTSFFFTQHVMAGRTVDDTQHENPRDALLKMDELTKKDPKYVLTAYAATQPQTEFQAETYEEEKESFKKKQKRDIAGF